MSVRAFSLFGAVLLVACGCNGGPSDSELKRACVDSGAFTMADNKSNICDCMVRQIKSREIDQEYILRHWEDQKSKTFNKSILPDSVDSRLQQMCGGYG